MAIKCHSGFVHYNMFHNNHCHGGGNNYGSIFNIKHNCGGGTNFWGGLGAGIGFGLGGMLSGMFGNFMGGFGNMFGGFGLGNMFGGFGMGGFGTPFGGGWGSGFGSNFSEGLKDLFGGKDKTDKTSKKAKSETKTKETKTKDNKPLSDKDYSKINDLHEKANAFISKAATEENLKELNALLEEVGKYNLEDENLSPENEEQLKNIKAQLEAKQKEYTTALENSAKPIAVTPGADPSQAPVVTPTPTPVAPQEVEETEEVEVAEDVEETETETPTPTKSETQRNIEGAPTAADLLKALKGKTWNNLTKDEKAALVASRFVKNIESLDDASREEIKTFFYNGRKNYQAGITVGDVKRAIDTYGEIVGCPRKIEGAYGGKYAWQRNMPPEEFSLKDKFINTSSEFTVNYTLKRCREETIYVSANGQEYALQLNESGEYELVQYPWHKGYSIADQTQSN